MLHVITFANFWYIIIYTSLLMVWLVVARIVGQVHRISGFCVCTSPWLLSVLRLYFNINLVRSSFASVRTSIQTGTVHGPRSAL